MSEPRFGPYRVVSEIASGVATTVVRARHESLPREVAIKRLRDVVPRGSAFAEALAHEAAVLAELSHPHVVLVYDFIDGPEGTGLVMEYVDGHSLADVRESAGGTLTAPEIAVLGAAIADALAHAHASGVVHRDVKPSNVALGRNGALKLVDFGAAAYAGEESPRAVRGDADADFAFGTPAYLAPEQLLGAEADPKSDVFSLGVVLYELAAGERPFPGKSPRTSGEMVPLASRAPEGSRELAVLVDRALARAPADRPSAEELAASLRELAPRVPTARAVRSLLARVRLSPGTAPPPPIHPKPARERLRAWRADGRSTLVLAAGLAVAIAAITVAFAIARDDARVARGAGGALAAAEVGELRVLAFPWAEVWVDGKLIDTTPFAAPIVLPAGAHRVALRHPDAPDELRDVRIRAGVPVSLDVTMAIRSGDAGSVDGGENADSGALAEGRARGGDR